MKNFRFFFILVCLVVIAAFAAITRYGRPESVERIDTVVVTETLRVVQPVEVEKETVVRVVTERLKVVRDTLLPENYAQKTGEMIRDGVTVEVPITQRVYGDSTYRAWVSGYRPQLDSIEVYRRKETVTIERTHLSTPAKRWSFGIQTGYGMTPKGMQPYVGVGVSWRLK